jgi:hypothetical protein
MFARKNRGRGVWVFAYPQEDRTIWFLVRHGDPYRRENILARGEQSSVAFRPLKFDVVIFDSALGELRVHAKQPWEVRDFRLEFGLYLFGDMNFFSAAPKYTLDPLRTDGPESLRCAELCGIKHVTLREVYLLWGGKPLTRGIAITTHRCSLTTSSSMATTTTSPSARTVGGAQR